MKKMRSKVVMGVALMRGTTEGTRGEGEVRGALGVGTEQWGSRRR